MIMGAGYAWGDSDWTQGNFLAMRIISHWNNLPRKVVDSPALDNFKIRVDRGAGPSCPDHAFAKKGWTR